MAIAETGQDSRHYLTNGVHGVIYRNVSGEALVQCVRKVSKGETWVQDTQESKETAENDLVGARVRDRLTAKELKIVALIVQGYKNKEIATQLGTTEQVIKNYLRNVYDKIGVSDRLELALFTIHHRIWRKRQQRQWRQRDTGGAISSISKKLKRPRIFLGRFSFVNRFLRLYPSEKRTCSQGQILDF